MQGFAYDFNPEWNFLLLAGMFYTVLLLLAWTASRWYISWCVRYSVKSAQKEGKMKLLKRIVWPIIVFFWDVDFGKAGKPHPSRNP